MTRWRLAVIAAAALFGVGAAPVPVPTPRPLQKPLVIFFGGYRSTLADMNFWAAAARRGPYGQKFEFMSVSYPANTSFVEREAVKADRVIIDALVAQIKESPNRGFVVVGHSSGGGAAATIVQEAGGGRKNIRLVILDDGVEDGFKPPAGFDAARQVECWSSANGAMASFTRDATRKFCKNYHEQQTTSCRTSYCLHFAIVNLGAAPDLTRDNAFVVAPNGTTGGYQNLRLNLVWLDSSVGL